MEGLKYHLTRIAAALVLIGMFVGGCVLAQWAIEYPAYQGLMALLTIIGALMTMFGLMGGATWLMLGPNR